MFDDIDYGPLAVLVGTWKGDKGMDVSPEPQGQEQNPFFEVLTFEAIGNLENAEQQNLVGLRYHQVVSRKSNDKVFHNETGYWMWDEQQDLVMQVLAIPRGVSLVAGGNAREEQGGRIEFVVSAALGGADWGIAQSPFMRDNAKTLGFRHTLSVRGDVLTYEETTVLEIYGSRFDHTDENTLTRE